MIDVILTESFTTSSELPRNGECGSRNAVNIDSTADQAFCEWWRNQLGTDGKGTLGDRGVMHMQQHNPQLANMYAKQFSEQYAQQITHGWQGDLGASGGQIKQTYQHNNGSIGGQSDVKAHH